MKNLKIVLAFLMPVLCVFSQSASGVVIVNDAVVGPSDYASSRVSLTLSKSIPSGQGLFAIDIENVTDSQFLFSSIAIAEYFKLFTVVSGTRLDTEFVLRNSPIVSNDDNPGSSLQAFALNESRYFGYWDDRFNVDIADSGDNFGWVLLTRTSSGLVASSSATAIGGGIIVGTTTQVPEPGSIMLIAFGILFVSMRRTVGRCP